MVVLIEGTHYTRYYGMKVHDFSYLVKGGRTIQGDVEIEERALNEVVGYMTFPFKHIYI